MPTEFTIVAEARGMVGPPWPTVAPAQPGNRDALQGHRKDGGRDQFSERVVIPPFIDQVDTNVPSGIYKGMERCRSGKGRRRRFW